MSKKLKRTSQTLRDVLFEEIEQLRGPEADPQKAMAVANLAKQIINIAKVELDFHRQVLAHQEAGHQISMGQMQLGSSAIAASAETDAMEAPSATASVQ